MVQVDGEKYPLGLGGPATKLVVITFAMLFIATALVSNRIVYRIQKAGYLGWDDKTIVIALVRSPSRFVAFHLLTPLGTSIPSIRRHCYSYFLRVRLRQPFGRA